jgi:hypothetical protein
MLYANDLSNALFHEDVIRPQSITGDSNGTGVDVSSLGANVINGRASLGAVSVFTSLVVTFKASVDNTTFTTCKKLDGTDATITLTAANADDLIAFQLPTAASATGDPYKYVRADWDITGTSCLACASIFGMKHFPNPTAGYAAAPPTIN